MMRVDNPIYWIYDMCRWKRYGFKAIYSGMGSSNQIENWSRIGSRLLGSLTND